MEKFVSMKLGENFGKLMLDIAQEHIKNGYCEKAIQLYVDSFPGFTEEYVVKLLKKEMELIVAEDGKSVELTDIVNKENSYDWGAILEDETKYLSDLVYTIYKLKDDFSNKFLQNINDVELNKHNKRISYAYTGRVNICARLISGKDCVADSYNVWTKMEDNVLNGDCTDKEYYIYSVYQYVNYIRQLDKLSFKFNKKLDFLTKHEIVGHITKIEKLLSDVFELLLDFSYNAAYYNPMCDEEIYSLTESIHDNMLATKYGNEYCKYKMLTCDIMDGYDAGWLSPDGKFYGADGSVSSMLHLNIADMIDKNTTIIKNSSSSPDYELEKLGWMKIHHNFVTGAYRYKKEPLDNDDYSLYCPTEQQIDAICKYINKFYPQGIYTDYICYQMRNDKCYTSNKLRSMDEIALHNIFD